MTAPTPSTVTDQMVERGAESLRQLEQGGKRLNAWSDLPNSTKKKWRAKARACLTAALDGMVVQGWREIDSAPTGTGS